MRMRKGGKAMGYFPMFCWSDKWCIEGTTAWFVTAESNILMQYDMKDESGKVLSKIPDAQGLRWNPECIKYNDEIICFPDRGKNVWIYSLLTHKWNEVIIEQKENKRMLCQFLYRDGDNICFVSRGLGNIYVLNMRTRKITEYINRRMYENSVDGTFRGLSNGVIIGKNIYFSLAETSSILIFNHSEKELSVKRIDMEIQIMRIQDDKDKIWLVGLDKAIYIWDLDRDTVKKVANFPKSFGGYMLQNDNSYKISFTSEKFSKSLFCTPIICGKYIWLIPWHGTEILYIEKESFKISTFEIEGEKAGDLDLIMLGARYLINYVREERYLGIFSGKSGCEIEIDMKEKKYRYLEMLINKEDLLAFNPIRERNEEMLDFFLQVLDKSK